MSFDLTNKVALVTGGACDIGRAVCLELARTDADIVFTGEVIHVNGGADFGQ